MEDFKNTNINSFEPQDEFHGEYLNEFDSEGDETEISAEELDSLKDTDPDLYYEIINKMIIKEETKIHKMLNDPELAKQIEIENSETEKDELRKAIENLYKKDLNDKYTDI